MAHVMDACDVFIKKPFDFLSLEAWTLYALVLTATIAVCVAIGTIRDNRATAAERTAHDRDTAKKLATLDAIDRGETTLAYRVGRQAFHYYAGHDARTLALLAGDVPRDQRAAIIDYLNYFEGISAGVYEKILSKKHVKRVLRSMMWNAWCQGVFLIYQFRHSRDAETRQLLRDNKNAPIHRPKTYIEFQRLAKEFGVPGELLPPSSGDWKLTKRQLRKLAVHSLRVAPPKDPEDHDAFEELLDDLLMLTSPCEPDELAAIGARKAYKTSLDDSPNVLPTFKLTGDPQIQSIAAALDEIKTALEKLSEAVQAASKKREAVKARSKRPTKTAAPKNKKTLSPRSSRK